jgi:modulator of FtsH protease
MQPDFSVTSRNTTVSVAQNRVLRNTYMLLAVAMIPAVAGAVIGTNMGFGFLRSSPIMGSFGVLILLYGLMFAIEKTKESAVGVGLLLLFTLLLGVLLGPILQVALARAGGAQLVMVAFGGTAAAMFGMATLAGTGRDFGKLGNFLMVGAIVLMVAVVANIFFQIPAVGLAISAAFIIFSSIMILFTVNQVVQGGETNYISAALSIIVSLYNIFSSLLHLLLAFTGDD